MGLTTTACDIPGRCTTITLSDQQSSASLPITSTPSSVITTITLTSFSNPAPTSSPEITTPTAAPESSLPSVSSAGTTNTDPTLFTSLASSASQAPDGTSAPLASASNSSKGVSTGAAAGIAIATAIIGAAIAFGIAFCLFKRRQKNARRAPTFDSVPEYVSPVEASKGLEMSHVPPPALSGASPPALIGGGTKGDINMADLSHSSDFLAGILPQAADDATVKERASMLFDQVQLHVENFYRDVHATMTSGVESELNKFQSGIVAMMRDSSRPTVPMKHALMTYVLRITSPEAGGKDRSIFPSSVVGVGHEGEFVRSQSLSPAYILYRRLASHLHTSLTSSPMSSPQMQSAIEKAAEHFSSTFFPWANPSYRDEDKDEHLAQVIANALDFNIWLYGQPFIYEFLWSDGMGRRGVVVAPGLKKVSDVRGRVERAGGGSRRGRGEGQVLLGAVVVPV
ncbi:hypothetical protein K491DRAFT_691972 [Lophiostoma macrostomum CBS 122681]|uniref:Uncharacterized protein n=1 Tax=Lophiostoma macrostomum CBS 122681 TaxID=1314788 RepID=A0A6A6TC21_9PLEO|nr:hypothetical protein K491DRAFT_691972 [Lophiostoma macrostomum CBS 122681]